MTDYTNSFVAEDIAENRNISILCYLSFLLIIPLFIRRNSAYVKFHTNQGLVLFVFIVLLEFAKRIIGLIFGFFTFMMVAVNYICSILAILTLVFMVIGILNTTAGRAKELPIIGKIRLIR